MAEEYPPEVTIIVPAYNSETFIERALESALAQTGVRFEVLVVDDASTDGTVAEVSSRYGHDPRLRLISLQQNSGPSGARNAAIEQAAGEWVAILDADDALEPDHLHRLTTVGRAHDADIVAGNFRYYDAVDGRLGDPAMSSDPAIQILDKYLFAGGARPYTSEADFGLLKPLFRRAFLERSGVRYPATVRHGEDVELVLFALLKGARYVLSRRDCTYLYTTRNSGFSRTPVNYSGQVSRTRVLTQDAEVSGDEALVRLLLERAAALQELELNYNWSLAGSGKPRLMLRALATPSGRRWIARRIKRKMLGQ